MRYRLPRAPLAAAIRRSIIRRPRLVQGCDHVLLGLAELAIYPVCLAAPGQCLGLELRCAGKLAQADRLRPIPRRDGDVAGTESGGAAPQQVQYRLSVLLSAGPGRRNLAEQGERRTD